MTLLATPSADPRFENIFQARFKSYVARVRELVALSKDEVVVATPFIDSHGVKLLAEAWRERPSVNRRMRIFVRDSIPDLLETGRSHGWEIYVYKQTEEGPHAYGMHCKFILVDQAVATLGSMNLIRTNLFHNLELGIEVRDPPAIQSLVKLSVYLREVSTRAA